VSGEQLAETAELARRIRHLEALLVDKGVIAWDTVERVMDGYEYDLGPARGARLVARAWTDEEFRERLLEDGTKAAAELGIAGAQGEHLRVVADSAEVHNVVVCTLCSCYPWAILGLPPAWYKDAAYRSRTVVEPRAVLRDFGYELPESVRIQVWDANAEMRYLVLPERPAGTERLSGTELAALVTRDSMIGVGRVTLP
jgi:nitrile hydratase